jgi:RNA polymerase sigma-70 factor (ECF subfamily)
MTGDPAAARVFLEDLYTAHHAEIHAYLSRMVGDDELAADLVQDTFVKAYRSFDSLADPSNARAWLYRIAGRTALDELRRRRILRFVPWVGETGGSAASAEEIALRTRFTSELERALAAIAPRHRMALLLADVHGLNGIELASALGTSHDAARALLARARESLRQALVLERAKAAGSEEGDPAAEAAGRPLRSVRTRLTGRRR